MAKKKSTKTKSSDTYDEDSIKVMKGLEGVRARPMMYIGTTDGEKDGNPGVFQVSKEIIDNAIDEALAGYNDTVGLAYNSKENSITVWDKGRGIPVGVHKDYKKEKLSTLTAIFTKLHAGGKLDNEGKSGYKFSVGVNGVGSSVTNALSISFEVWTNRDKTWHYQKFSKGVPQTKVVKKIPKGILPKGIKLTSAGTIVKFVPDTEIFGKRNTLNVEAIDDMFSIAAYLNPTVTFHLYKDGELISDLENSKGDTIPYRQKDGLRQYIKDVLEELEVEKIHKTPFIFKSDNVDLAVQWTDHEEEEVYSYANSSPTELGGTHVLGFNRALTEVLSKYQMARTKPYKPEDLRMGLVGGLNVKLSAPQFDSQTKERLITKEMTDVVLEQVKPALKEFFENNKSLGKLLIQRAVAVREAVSELRLSRKAAAELSDVRGREQLPPLSKFMSCTSKNPEEVELFIVEGDSAKGSARGARDSRTQEILALKGKPLNVTKSGVSKALESEEVLNILKAIGFKPNLKDPLSKRRVGKVILLSDSDADGCHISVLVAGILHMIVPSLIQEGRLYVANPPLFVAKKGTKNFYANTMTEINKLTGGTMDAITRLKGLGEMNADTLRDTVLSPETRILTQIAPPTKEDTALFMAVIGDGVEMRKEILGLE